jgi:hypothetical protein
MSDLLVIVRLGLTDKLQIFMKMRGNMVPARCPSGGFFYVGALGALAPVLVSGEAMAAALLAVGIGWRCGAGMGSLTLPLPNVSLG